MGNPHLGFTPQAQSHAETCYCMSDIPVIIHMYLWSVQVHVVGGTDQGVAQLQQEFSPDVDTQIPPAAIFPG